MTVQQRPPRCRCAQKFAVSSTRYTETRSSMTVRAADRRVPGAYPSVITDTHHTGSHDTFNAVMRSSLERNSTLSPAHSSRGIAQGVNSSSPS